MCAVPFAPTTMCRRIPDAAGAAVGEVEGEGEEPTGVTFQSRSLDVHSCAFSSWVSVATLSSTVPDPAFCRGLQ
jgi:hypothetical protein